MMRRAVLRVLIVLSVLLLVAVAALPFALPPLVEGWVKGYAGKYGVPVAARLKIGYCWRNGPGIGGRFTVSVPGTAWKAGTEFAASPCEWQAKLRVPETEFDSGDPFIGRLLGRYPLPAVSNLVFSGRIAVDARVERTFGKPVPVWSVRIPIREVSASAVSNDRPLGAEGLSVTLGVSGISDHLDIDPMYLRAATACGAGFSVTNFSAAIRATERMLMVNEATAGFCGGRISLYSLFLDPKRLNAGFTLFLDDIDSGQVMGYFRDFRGEASGRLHGKIQAFVREGGTAVRLKDAFLYSIPGQVGKLRIRDSAAVADNLALTGLDEDARNNVAEALTDLDYSVLRMDLSRIGDREARLSIRLKGSAERGGAAVPVDLTVNFNGELEQMINTGLGLSSKLKGKRK